MDWILDLDSRIFSVFFNAICEILDEDAVQARLFRNIFVLIYLSLNLLS